MLFQELLKPFTYLLHAPGEIPLLKLVEVFNYWLNVPADQLTLLQDMF